MKMTISRRSFRFVAGLVCTVVCFSSQLLCSQNSPGDAPSALELVVVDVDTQHRTPARVYIRGENGRFYVPDQAIEVPIGNDRWFVTEGFTRLSLPPGRIRLRVERGTEYRPVIETLRISPGTVTHRVILLRRWINMRKFGYESGDDHLHVPASELGPMLAAEGLDFGTSLSWWNGPKFPISSGQSNVQDLYFAGHQIQATLFDAEVEHPWGAAYLVGLKQPITLAADPMRSNLPFVRTAHEEGALVCYQGGWSREALLDSLLGYVDVINVCENNFARYKFLPRQQYSNLLNVPGFPEYPNTPEGMMRMYTETYYRLLNCGLRLAAGAGSATGVKTTPAGYNRSYVRMNNRRSIGDFLERWRQGRNFVTNGPMIFLEANGSYSPGDVIALPESGGKVHVTAKAVSDQPLRSLEVVVNGLVVKHAAIGPGTTQARITFDVKLREGSWIAARATADDRLLSDEEMNEYRTAGPFSEEPSRLRFGHTSPIYVTVGGKSVYVASSVREAEHMLDAFEQFSRGAAEEQYQSEITTALKKAREKLSALGK